jgi:hypothetical protein
VAPAFSVQEGSIGQGNRQLKDPLISLGKDITGWSHVNRRCKCHPKGGHPSEIEMTGFIHRRIFWLPRHPRLARLSRTQADVDQLLANTRDRAGGSAWAACLPGPAFSLYDLFVVTEEQIQSWADEAESGYDVAELKRRGRGRPGRGAEPMQVVAVRLTAEELGALDAAAERDDLSRSEAIRAALAHYAARRSTPAPSSTALPRRRRAGRGMAAMGGTSRQRWPTRSRTPPRLRLTDPAPRKRGADIRQR